MSAPRSRNNSSDPAGDTTTTTSTNEEPPLISTSLSSDDELKRATAMAIAIKNNPKMPMDEIQKLLHANEQQHQQQQQQKKKSAFRFDGSRLKAIGAVVTATTSSKSSHGPTTTTTTTTAAAAAATTLETTYEESHKTSPTMEKEKKNRPFDGHRLKVAFGKDATTTTAAAAASNATQPQQQQQQQQPQQRRTPPPSPIKGGVVAGGEKFFSMIATAATLPSDFKSKSRTPFVTTAGTTGARPSVPIRLTGIAWKRRGGMGKYSSSGSWERRRIELQGTRILYYAKDESDRTELDIDNNTEDQNNTNLDSTTESNKSDRVIELEEGVSVTKQSTWFESAFASTAAQNAQEDFNAPRGSLDLAKEKANVHAALGHGGAPSPFCISIKVRGETKWKFCFDHHRTQMEWLAAMTDIVVQTSVDLYNAQLLEAADPVHQAALAADPLAYMYSQANVMASVLAVGAPMITGTNTNTTNTTTGGLKSPPGNAGTRLWQTQYYNISSLTPPDDDDDDNNDDDDEDVVGSGGDLESVEGMMVHNKGLSLEDHAAAQAHALQESDTVHVIPQQSLFYLWILVNTAMGVARLSSLQLQQFWYWLVTINAALFFGLVRTQPDIQSLLSFVQASPAFEDTGPVHKTTSATATTGAGTATKKQRTASKDLLDSTGSASKVNKGYKPVAGTSTMKIKNPTDLPVNAKNEVFAGWRCPSGHGLAVRSHGYMTTHKKIPSPGELYECVQCDIFEAPVRYDDMAPKVQLPRVQFNDPPNMHKTWRTPDLFLITIALPTDPPKLTGGKEGGGYMIVMYYKMKQDTRDILRRVTADDYDNAQEQQRLLQEEGIQTSKVNAVRLMEEWIRRAPSDPKWFSRFKCIPNAHNLKEIGMPSWIAKYNGKPFLIKRPGVTGFIQQHPELSCFEFDISLHPFPYLARQGICFLKETFFKKVLVSFGFVIEGRADDELPECVIGVMQLCYPDPAHALQAKDWFGGTSPKSFELEDEQQQQQQQQPQQQPGESSPPLTTTSSTTTS